MDNDNITILQGGSQKMDPMSAAIAKANAEYENKVKQLDSKIPRDVIAKREAGNGRTLDYLEGWYVIARMNEIFGQGGWAYVTEEMRNVFTGEINGKQVAHYIAKVTVKALGTVFSDYGYGDGTDKYNPGKAHELAVKEAVTDGIKRACKNFGMSMGLALYDKTQENVENEAEVKSKARAGNTKRAEANESSGVPDNNKPTNATALEPSAAKSDKSTGASTALSAEATRDEVNQLIQSASSVAISKKKFADKAAIRGYVQTTYSVEKSSDLSDDKAKEFALYLMNLIHS